MAVEPPPCSLIKSGDDKGYHQRRQQDVRHQDGEVQDTRPVVERVRNGADVGVIYEVGSEKQCRRHDGGNHQPLVLATLTLRMAT